MSEPLTDKELPPRALVLHRRVAAGLRDEIRHMKYPDSDHCARCGAIGASWPCPNIAFDELREEIKTLLATIDARDERIEKLVRLRAVARMWDDYFYIGHREFHRKYPWLKRPDYEDLMYAFTHAALGEK